LLYHYDVPEDLEDQCFWEIVSFFENSEGVHPLDDTLGVLSSSIVDFVPDSGKVSTSIRNSFRRQSRFRRRDLSVCERGEKRRRRLDASELEGRRWPHLEPIIEHDEQKDFKVDSRAAIRREGRKRIIKPQQSTVARQRLHELMTLEEDYFDLQFPQLSDKQTDEAAAYAMKYNCLPEWIYHIPQQDNDYHLELFEIQCVEPIEGVTRVRRHLVA
jgi:hypothetical protein